MSDHQQQQQGPRTVPEDERIEATPHIPDIEIDAPNSNAASAPLEFKSVLTDTTMVDSNTEIMRKKLLSAELPTLRNLTSSTDPTFLSSASSTAATTGGSTTSSSSGGGGPAHVHHRSSLLSAGSPGAIGSNQYGVPSPPSSIIAEPPSPTLSVASFRTTNTYDDNATDSSSIHGGSTGHGGGGSSSLSTVTNAYDDSDDDGDNSKERGDGDVERMDLDDSDIGTGISSSSEAAAVAAAARARLALGSLSSPPLPSPSTSTLAAGAAVSPSTPPSVTAPTFSIHSPPSPLSATTLGTASSMEGVVAEEATKTDLPPTPPHDGNFMVPRRQILTKEDLDLFHQSGAYRDIFEFLDLLNESVVGVKTTDECYQSETVRSMMELLEQVDKIPDEYPPESGHESRFGNPAFRKFYDQVVISTPEWLENFKIPKESIPEFAKYFTECWGNRKRIDYGTGHEASFLAFLYCFHRLGLITEQDRRAIVILVFFKYIEVMRRLQFAYWLEPAGSHGVWGLDDYHFLPFLFGAAQLRGHKYIRPKSIHDNDVVQEFSKQYMYLSCVKFINSVKTASLSWHSPMLNDISAVKTWDKVNSGMIKMYKAEVFGKLPIMQHFLFGSMISFQSKSNFKILDDDEQDAGVEGHAHIHAFGQEFPTCCGMKIPSAIAASAAAGGGESVPGMVRRLPFD